MNASRLRDIEHEIRTGDLLLWRPTSLFGWLIQVAGRGWHSHAEMAWWTGVVPYSGTLMTAGILKGGGRSVPLAGEVERYPGCIEWYSVREDEFNRRGAMREMLRLTNCRYGWLSVLKAAALHMPVVRLFARPERIDTTQLAWPPACAEAVAYACRVGGGIDPVPHLADRLTEPADLSRSMLFRFEGALVP